MKNIILLSFAFLLINTYSLSAQELPEQAVNTIKSEDIRIRDPFVFLDEKSGYYYIPVSAGSGFKMYKSQNLEEWIDLGMCFQPEDDFWGKTDFWAPDMYMYKGKYYIFGTFSSKNKMRGTSILVATKPEGPYSPLMNEPITPPDWMALDGALYIDDKGQPWMLYCHEWLQVKDGEIVAQRMSKDLKRMIGEPVILFKASYAPWTGCDAVNYVTDAPFIYKIDNKRLCMTWSSVGKNGKYCIGASYSENGILGPWIHEPEPLNDDDGGHAMLFTAKDGKLKISYHAPNSKTETLIIKNAVSEDGKLKIIDAY